MAEQQELFDTPVYEKPQSRNYFLETANAIRETLLSPGNIPEDPLLTPARHFQKTKTAIGKGEHIIMQRLAGYFTGNLTLREVVQSPNVSKLESTDFPIIEFITQIIETLGVSTHNEDLQACAFYHRLREFLQGRRAIRDVI